MLPPDGETMMAKILFMIAATTLLCFTKIQYPALAKTLPSADFTSVVKTSFLN